jgi:hypothetical protein
MVTVPLEHRRPPMAYSATELHDMLVADALAHIATPLRWAEAAYVRIAEGRRLTVDAAYREVLAAVVAGGGYGMPM